MSFNYVTIYYGPTDSYFTLCHRPQKLYGLRDHLRKIGYRVDLKPVNFLDLCLFEMCGYEVFRCNLNNLRFNLSASLDPVAERAIKAVITASDQLSNARYYLWIYKLLEKETLRRNQYSPKDYFLTSVDLVPNDICVRCCGLMISKKPDEELKRYDSDESLDKVFGVET